MRWFLVLVCGIIAECPAQYCKLPSAVFMTRSLLQNAVCSHFKAACQLNNCRIASHSSPSPACSPWHRELMGARAESCSSAGITSSLRFNISARMLLTAESSWQRERRHPSNSEFCVKQRVTVALYCDGVCLAR